MAVNISKLTCFCLLLLFSLLAVYHAIEALLISITIHVFTKRKIYKLLFFCFFHRHRHLTRKPWHTRILRHTSTSIFSIEYKNRYAHHGFSNLIRIFSRACYSHSHNEKSCVFFFHRLFCSEREKMRFVKALTNSVNNEFHTKCGML